MSVRATSDICGQGSDQDAAFYCCSEDLQYGIVYDGHGHSDCIAKLKVLHTLDAKGNHSDLASSVLVDPQPANRIFEHVMDCEGGAMMNMVCIKPQCIENYNVGDTQSWIYAINEAGEVELVHESHAHASARPAADELKRLESSVGNVAPYVTSTRSITLLDDETFALEREYQLYRDFGQGVRLATTQSLGHKGVTGCAPHTMRISRTANSRYVCILVSDGVTQVLTRAGIEQLYREHRAQFTAEHVVTRAQAQWRKTWRVIDRLAGNRPVWRKFPTSNLDDVSAVVMHVPAPAPDPPF